MHRIVLAAEKPLSHFFCVENVPCTIYIVQVHTSLVWSGMYLKWYATAAMRVYAQCSAILFIWFCW